MLKVTGLKKNYGSQEVIQNVTFSADCGKVYGFLGPNGTGKSTTMNMLTGYLAPDEGDILINDVSMIRNPKKAKRSIGYLPEQPPLYMDMNVTEYLSYAAELKGLSGTKCVDEVQRVCKAADLIYVRRRMIKQLSKGYKQRVGLAQALLADPEILVLDEPSSGLDPKQNVEMREMIREIGKEHTVILSTHILSEITAICDHVMVLYKGRLVADNTPEGLVEKYNEQQRIRLVLKGNSTAAERAIETLEKIEAHHVLKEDADSCELEILAKRGEDVREELSSACIRAGYCILELHVNKVSLEEVYLRLTGGEQNEDEEEDVEDAGSI